MVRPPLAALVVVLAGCPGEESAKETCVAYQYCCSWHCTTAEEREALGPDPCDCTSDTSDTGGPGECQVVEGECAFVEPI